MKKKKLILIGVIAVILVVASTVTLSLILFKNSDKEIVSNSKREVNNNNFLTLMIEQEDGSYQESTTNTWPDGNYVFNKELSRCENGGELDWDSENKRVILYSNKSDGCYVYFDRYNAVEITNVTTSTTYNSVTLTVASQAGENEIARYYFTRNGGDTWEESTSPTYTYSGLSSNTEYNFRVYAVDTEGNSSNIYTLSATTNAYTNPVVNSVTVTNTTTDSITISVNASGGTNNISRYYYSSNGGSSYRNTTSSSYTFTGLSVGRSYQIRVYVVDTNGVQSNVYSLSVQTDAVLLADYIKGLYTSQGSNGIYYHTSSLSNSARDNSYRYAGSNDVVNNYVCFGTTASSCSSNYRYRIIGVFGDEVKLIKSTSIGNYAWDNEADNTWVSSNRPDIYTTLNSTYLSGLSSTWQSKIATHGWSVGGLDRNDENNTPRTVYNLEVGSSSIGTTDSMKIGLMYVSDFGFAANSGYWSIELGEYETAAENNWLAGLDEWTITRSNYGDQLFYIMSTGYVRSDSYYHVDEQLAVRPCFYLNSNVTYTGGTGTQSDPIRIQ